MTDRNTADIAENVAFNEISCDPVNMISNIGWEADGLGMLGGIPD